MANFNLASEARNITSTSNKLSKRVEIQMKEHETPLIDGRSVQKFVAIFRTIMGVTTRFCIIQADMFTWAEKNLMHRGAGV